VNPNEIGNTILLRTTFLLFFTDSLFSFFAAEELFRYSEILFPVYFVAVITNEGIVRLIAIIPTSDAPIEPLPHEERNKNPVNTAPNFNFLISVLIFLIFKL
jgi:hypothetical protein